MASIATPEDWAAMQPFQDAIDAANRRVVRLAVARRTMERAALELRAESDAAEWERRTGQAGSIRFVS